MKRCNSCNCPYPNNYTVCPECGRLLTVITEADLEKEAAEQAELAEKERLQAELTKKPTRGFRILTVFSIIAAILDLCMIVLFSAGQNFAGTALSIAALLCTVIGLLFGWKPDLVGKFTSSHSEGYPRETALRQWKNAANFLLLLALFLTAVQIGVQIKTVLEIVSSTEAI